MVLMRTQSHCASRVFVDDGSGDSSFVALMGFRERRPGTKVVKLSRNFGAPAATKLGQQFVTGDCFLYLAADVQESRERIVHGREEERLRVRRDLHDGIGPTLAAASLQCDALRDRWPIADPAAAMLLGQVKSEIAHCVLDVRRVVDGLRPPALDDLGLAGVVREHAATLTAAGLEVDVHCPDALDVPSAAVEVVMKWRRVSSRESYLRAQVRDSRSGIRVSGFSIQRSRCRCHPGLGR